MAKENCLVRIIHQEKVDAAILQSLPDEKVICLSRIFKIFSDPGRIKILYALAKQEMCVCDLAAFLGISESAVSHQLRILRNSGLVENRREGTVLYYINTVDGLQGLISAAQKITEGKS